MKRGNDMKISIIGAGNVGATTTNLLLEDKLADEIVLIDIIDGLAKGKILDLLQSRSLRNYLTKLKGSEDFEDIKGSDIVILTCGVARKPGMSRTDLLKINSDIISSVCLEILKYAKDSIILVVTNPLDVMCYLTKKVTNFPKERVFGMAGVLDTARFKHFLGEELNIDPKEIECIVLGSHGDEMVPVISKTFISGKHIEDILNNDKIKNIVERTKYAGAEIVNLLKTGSAYYSPSASVAYMIDCIVHNRKNIVPTSCYLEGEYGENDVYCGVPAILGREGVEKIVELNLSDEELKALKNSTSAIRKVIQELS